MIIDLKEKKLSLTEALKLAKDGDILILEDKTYEEKIRVTTPNITWVGSKNTKIVFGATAKDILPEKWGGDGKKTYGTTGSATVLVAPEAIGFKAIGIIFENSFKRDGRIEAQAVAFKSETSKIWLKNCTFISHQDTLYLDYGTENILEDCSIFGDIDFIFGSADCTFKNCKIHAVHDEKTIAYFTAPDTFRDNKYGFVFQKCKLSMDPHMEGYLGRPWYPSLAKKEVLPRVKFEDCIISHEIKLFLKQMHEGDPTNYVLQLENNTIL